MKRHSSETTILTTPPFLLGVLLLLLNDWVLKAAVGSWWTGKLSDFAGLFTFTLFWYALLPAHRAAVFAIIAAAFVLWKSPASTPALDMWNHVAPLPMERVIDYTDWVALSAMIPAWHMTGTRRIRGASLRRRASALAVALVSVVAFSATSVRRPNPITDSPAYTLPGSSATVRAALDSMGFEPYIRRGDTTDGADTLSLHVRHPPERWVSIALELRELNADSATVRVVGLIGARDGPAPSKDAILHAFRAQVVEPLREWIVTRRPARNGTPPSER